MPKLSEILKNVATLPVPYRGTIITIHYKPEEVTATKRAALQQRVADGKLDRDDQDAAFLAETLTSWDLTDDDDKPLPITFEVMQARSSSLQMALVNAIYDDQRNPQQGH